MLTRSCAAVVTAILSAAVLTGGAQAPTPTHSSLDEPQVLNTSAGRVRVVPIKGLSYPWALAFLPDGSMLVTEMGRNTLRMVRDGVLDPTPITGLPDGMMTSSRQGYSGVDVAVHPQFAENRLVYVAYWKSKTGAGDMRTAVLVRGRLEGHEVTGVQQLFESTSWTDGPGAARLVFDRSGKLFMSVGEPGFADSVGHSSWAQDPGQHAGKILRLNDDGTVPSDNPFVGRPGYKPEIYALGIRNALGLTIHPDTGELWETEMGPQGGDEINIIRSGLNYGWPLVTYGRAYTHDPDGTRSGLPPASVQPPTAAHGMEEPVTFYKPAIAISGMAFYTGAKFPAWRRNLFVGGLAGMQLSRLIFNAEGLEVRREALLLELRQRIRDVRQGPDGYLYLTTDMKDGAILRLEPEPLPN